MFRFTKKAKGKTLLSIPTKLIVPNSEQPRCDFAEDKLSILADSIKKYGLIEPLSVRPIKDCGGGTVYELISGERRLRACKILCMTRIPCVCENMPVNFLEATLSRDLTRCNLNMFEQAESIRKMLRGGAISVDKLADRLSVSTYFIEDKLLLLSLAPHERQLILYSGISENSALALAKLSDTESRLLVINSVIESRLTGEKSDAYILGQASKSEKSAEPKEDRRKVKSFVKDTKIFVNSIDRAVEILKESGIAVECEKSENMLGDIEITIKIPG